MLLWIRWELLLFRRLGYRTLLRRLGFRARAGRRGQGGRFDRCAGIGLGGTDRTFGSRVGGGIEPVGDLVGVVLGTFGGPLSVAGSYRKVPSSPSFAKLRAKPSRALPKSLGTSHTLLASPLATCGRVCMYW